jgi:hypothetical protein
LHKPNEAKGGGAVGERIDLPADGHRADLEAELRQAAGSEIEKEGMVLKQRASAGGRH